MKILFITILGLTLIVLAFVGLVPFWSIAFFFIVHILIIYKSAYVDDKVADDSSGAIVRYGGNDNYKMSE